MDIQKLQIMSRNRHGRISRNNGIDLVLKYEQKTINHINLFCDWLGIDDKSLKFILDDSKIMNIGALKVY